VSYTGFAIILFGGIAVGAVFVLRRREPATARPFRAWGYPWAPAIFVAVSAIVVLNEIWRNPRPSAAGIAIIAAGIPVYLWMTRRRG
jgi:APA family basic amino acid/polyamine antiporter